MGDNIKSCPRKIGCEVVDTFSVDSEKCHMSKICEKGSEFSGSLHLVGILFPHINDDARSKSHKKCVILNFFSHFASIITYSNVRKYETENIRRMLRSGKIV